MMQITQKHAGIVSLLLSVAGFVCLAIGVSGPSTAGLREQAFADAFEADEQLMLWTMTETLLAPLGFSSGLLLCPRTRTGRMAMIVALLAAVWVYVRRSSL